MFCETERKCGLIFAFHSYYAVDVMTTDKFSAVWVSHSSIRDYLACPRAYYLKNVYKSPSTNRKFAIVTPALSLGQAVHDVIERLSVLPVSTRFSESLLDRFEKVWTKVSGKRGGFFTEETELRYKERGREMIRRVMLHPGILQNKAVKISGDLPQFTLSEKDNIILCGKIDWLEYLPETDSVHVVDFKTSKHEEDPESLQLPIYHLLVHYTQNRPVTKASYWYLEKDDELTEMPLPDLETAQERVMKVARQMKLARQLEKFACPTGGCRDCEPFERVLRGEGESVGTDSMRRDLYVLPPRTGRPEAEIL